ncbi:MAG: transglycosylase SLT domain-containing protein [Muribaculaceae bacterium]|nr:transglycosylase SLT domain-containing protein [Muribaculaceae bacterium]
MTRHRLITVFTIVLTAMTIMAATRPSHDKKAILTLKNSITDDDIVFPESFDTDVHQMMTNWYLQNYAVLDADVENKSFGEVNDETYIRRLTAIPSVIELPYNQIVRKHIERYVYRSRTLVEEMLGMSLYYMPIFEQALEKEGLPLELKYLPIVESALDPNAVSRAGAAGLWQFMIGTGKGLGLEINSLVDERRDPYRSSAMAAKYLKNLYQIYNDWSLAIAAYNCGPGNVNKALHRNGGSGDFWDIYEYLPRETRGYVPAFIAANYAMTYYKQHNISPSLARKPLITDTVTVNRRIHFAQIAQVLNIPIEEIRTFNPQYRKDVIPGDNHPYVLVLPSQQIYSYIMSEDSIDNYRDDLYAHRPIVEPGGLTPTTEEYISGTTASGEMRTTNHKVERGETMSSIASKYGMTTNELMALNNRSNERVRRGETLKVRAGGHNNASADNEEIGIIPSSSSTNEDDMAMADPDNEQAQFDEVKEVERTAASKAPYKGSYTSKSDQPATAKPAKSSRNDEQSARQSASRSNSRDWKDRNSKYSHRDSGKNRHRGDNSERSSKGKNHKKADKPKQPSEVTVQKGESLTKIAEKAGVSVKDIERANGIEDGNKIKAGDKIKIPTKAEAKQAEKKSKSGKSGKGSSTEKSSKKSKSSSKASKESSSKSSKSSSGKSGKSGSKKSKKK